MRKSGFILALLAVTAVTVLTTGSPASADTQVKGDIVSTAVGAGQFTTLASLLKSAGLVGVLRGKGPFTVLAPTDAAFAKVPKSTLAALGANKAKLRSVLLYHVLAGKVPAAKVVKLRVGQDPQRADRPNPSRRTERLRRRRAGREDGRCRVERRHPRDQQGADPSLAAERAPTARRVPAPGGWLGHLA